MSRFEARDVMALLGFDEPIWVANSRQLCWCKQLENIVVSSLELRQMFEFAFLPLKCVCLVDEDGLMSISLYQPQKGHAAFLAERVCIDGLGSMDDIERMVLRMKAELRRRGLNIRES
jgi:hypothetical protein